MSEILSRRDVVAGGLAWAVPLGAVQNAKAIGAQGDGLTDDTQAIQQAIDEALRSKAGRVHLPSGRYRVTKTLIIASADRIEITGDGWSTEILHENDEHLFLWPKGTSCRECSMRHLRIVSTNKKGHDTAAIACLGGVERSFLGHLMFMRGGSAIITDTVADTSTFDHCLMWEISGVGYNIARGSEVRIFGGRVVGDGSHNPRNIGVLLPTDNGGVHVVTTDLINLHTGMQIGVKGNRSNREIFITHATFDSSKHGLRQFDGAYTSIAGCWAASSDEDQIVIEDSAHGAILGVSGGTIFNGGAYGRPGAHHGFVAHAGSFILNGVHIRHNQGIGVWAGPSARDYAVTGCRIHDNALGMKMEAKRGTISANVFSGNGKDVDLAADPERVATGNVWKLR